MARSYTQMFSVMEGVYAHGVRLPIKRLGKATEQSEAARAWCEGRHGPGYTLSGRWMCGEPAWAVYGMSFYFKDENDAFEFKLRWG